MSHVPNVNDKDDNDDDDDDDDDRCQSRIGKYKYGSVHTFISKYIRVLAI